MNKIKFYGKTLKESGFTLIELVMVIVILGILAAIAIPKYMDLSGSAQQATVSGYAASLASGASIGFAACKVGTADCTAAVSTALKSAATCAGLTAVVASVPVAPSGGTWSFGGGPLGTAGTTVTCTINATGGNISSTVTAVPFPVTSAY